MTSGGAAFVDTFDYRRDRSRPPPLGVWAAAFAIVAVMAALAAAAFIYFKTPVATPSDARFYAAQLDRLDRQVRQLEAAGAEPLSVVFIGTSRIKNVAFDPAEVAASARSAGVERPVASTFMAINWGGFERFEPAIGPILDHRPDVVVLMPELFVEDFNHLTRAQLGYRFLQTRLWGQDYKLFGTREFAEPVCHGFERSVEDRLSDHREWIRDGSDLPGPRLARQAARAFADAGIQVIVADVPASRAMAARRPSLASASFLAEAGLADSPRVRTAWIGAPLPDQAYCDWAHVNPAHSKLWQRAFFSKAATDLNRL